MTETPPRNNSTALRRALAVVGYIADAVARGERPSLADLAAGTGLSKSTLLRLLAPLREHALVAANADGRYGLGVWTAILGSTYLDSLELREVAAPALADLTHRSGESSHLVLYDHTEVVYIDKVDSSSSVRMVSRVGGRNPAYCTAVGKAFLAYLPESEVQAVIDLGLRPRTPHTLTTAEDLRADLERIRERGFAIDDIENEAEIRCVAAPIFDLAHHPVAAVSVSGPVSRVTTARVPELGTLVRQAADDVSARLGGRSRERPAAHAT
jgi:IclR family transcriptional regulator, acetate operon repressor